MEKSEARQERYQEDKSDWRKRRPKGERIISERVRPERTAI